ncbi:MAG: hypothetical protein GDA44_06915 [Prochloron sp. SP5CPC1]|nr:hypothetical protein [Candidatus Paraprochloron terpiosi SP5CPC1]
MNRNREFLTIVLKIIKAKGSANLFASTIDGNLIFIVIKDGEITKLRYRNQSGAAAVQLLDSIKVKSCSVKKYTEAFLPSQDDLPSTGDILKLLLSGLSWKVAKPQETRSKKSVEGSKVEKKLPNTEGAAEGVPPKTVVIPNSALTNVKKAFQEAVGPIAGVIYDNIYQEVVQEFGSAKNSIGFHSLVQRLTEEIDKPQHKKEFLKSIGYL